MSYDPAWIQEDRQRVIDMNRWYILDGRHKKNHKLHGLYTGLAQLGKRLDRQNELKESISNAYDSLKQCQ